MARRLRVAVQLALAATTASAFVVLPPAVKAGLRTSPSTVLIGTKRSVAPRAAARKPFGGLPGMREQPGPTPSREAPSSKKAFAFPSFPSTKQTPEAEAPAPRQAPSFSMPAFSVPSFASASAAPSEPVVTPVEEIEPPAAAAPSVPPTPNSPFAQLGGLLVAAVETNAQLAVANVQLGVLRQVRKAQLATGDAVAAAQAAPARALDKAQRAAYATPFYAKAAVQLAVEDTSAQVASAKAEAERAINDAPRYLSTEIETRATSAQRAAAAAVDAAVAVPEKLIQQGASRVRNEFNSAQAQVDGALSKAKGVRDGLSSKR